MPPKVFLVTVVTTTKRPFKTMEEAVEFIEVTNATEKVPKNKG